MPTPSWTHTDGKVRNCFADLPLVSAVIPTRNRPELVLRAVRSALRQTYPRIEVVVVIDGPDHPTEKALHSIDDARLRVICLTEHVGGSGARNVGVQAAQGEWIGFLDDDDEWSRNKIEFQMVHARSEYAKFPILSCLTIARTKQADYIWPRRLPLPHEPISEYLFCRKSVFQGEGMIQTSTLLTKRDFLKILPFKSGLKKHQDWDWIITACAFAGTKLIVCPDPLLTYHVDGHRQTISNSDDWRHSLEWIRDRRNAVTPRAYAAFLLLVVAAQAARDCSMDQYLDLLSEAIRVGSPSALEVSLFVGMRLIPRRVRHRLRAALGGNKQ
jgi:glycosyltransferase involved in cell wall biosynthesis